MHTCTEARGAPVESTGEGGYQRVRIKMRGMRFEGHAPEVPEDIYRGALVLEGAEHNGLAPLPMQFEGDVRFALTMRDYARTLLLYGTGITIEADGEFRFVEKVDFT